MQTFNTSTLKPFYPAADEASLANVDLRLPENRSKRRRQAKRTTAMLSKTRAAVQTIERLPAQDESVHCILSGEFALWNFVPAVLELSGKPIDELWIATLGFSKKNVEHLDQLAGAGQVKRLEILCSHYFAAQDAAIYSQAAEMCSTHGFRIAAMRTHAKLLLIATGDARIVVESSANLRSCFNVEQATVFNDPDLFAFHREWIDQLLTKGATP